MRMRMRRVVSLLVMDIECLGRLCQTRNCEVKSRANFAFLI